MNQIFRDGGSHRATEGNWIKFFGLVLALLAVAVGPTAAEVLTGRVVGVSDGDTITVLDSTKTQHKIRVAAIDAPEK